MQVMEVSAARALPACSSPGSSPFPSRPQQRFCLRSTFVHNLSFANHGSPCLRSVAARCSPLSVRAESKADTDNSITGEQTGMFKRMLLPIIDRNPYLSEATRQAAATTTALAKKYGAEITVVVIDEDTKESTADHELRIKNIRWHLAEGGFEEFGLMERLGEGKRPAAVIGEVADDLSLDLVVLSMETIHSKHIDGNLLAEFVPCPILLLPL